MPPLEFDDEPPEQLTVDTALENRAEAIPDERFVLYGPEERSVSYREMDRIANAIGNSLREAGVGRGGRVSVMVETHFTALCAFFGIVKGGMIYSPINDAYRGATLSYQLDDTAPEALVIEDRFLDRLDEVAPDLTTTPRLAVVETDAESAPPPDGFETIPFEELLEGSPESPDVDTAWDDVASVLYTSGTTGQPKGVCQQHRWILSNYAELGWRLQSPEDVTHTSLPLYHVGGLYNDILGAMMAGASVSLWDRFSPDRFWDRIDRAQASRTMLVSSMIPWLMNRPERATDSENSLDKVLMAPLPENYDEIADRFGFDIVQTAYGSTEVGNALAGLVRCFDDEFMTPERLRRGMAPDEVLDTGLELGVPIVESVPGDGWLGSGEGRPNLELAIVDERDEPVPTGEVGELVARPKRAAILFKEYDGKPTETVASWRNLWYHTGDAMYRDEAGQFYFVDRMGAAIRRHGENISSEQVQSLVNSHDAVERSAAFPVPADEGDEDEVAVAVETAEGAQLSEAELRRYLEDRMPEFMRPRYITFVAEIPTTATNKMEKYKLRQELVERHDLE
ncbi:AMP-binding protein [Haloglomus litoreum]|uniref:AMP-binding protein n=1 Tax=Haloglomus litoreum TaxID=3034026 RepID=UPI0023E8D8D7|nr:AMP-binding protein [Haloglomus sp. DT116]